MSFQNKGSLTQRDAGYLTDGEIGYENSSRFEPKRGHQWFMDANGSEVFSNKKQAIEGVNSRAVGISHMNVSPWHNTFNFQSGFAQFADHRFEYEPVRTVNLVDRSIPSVEGGSSNMERKDFQDHYNNVSMGVSMSHSVEDPSCFDYGGIRKVKVNQVRDSANGISTSMGQSYSRGGNDSISMGLTYKGDSNTVSLGSNNDNSDEGALSMGHTYRKVGNSFMSMFQTFNKEEGNCMSMGYNYSKRNENTLPMGQSFPKEDANLISIGQSSEKGDSNIFSMGSYYNKGHESYISTGHAFGKLNESFFSMGSSYDKGSNNVITAAPTYDKADFNLTWMESTQDKGDSGVLSMGRNYTKGESNTISFGGFQHETKTNHSGNITGSYDLTMYARNSAQPSEEPSHKDLVESSVDPIVVDPIVNSTPETNPIADTVPKSKEPKTAKKAPANNFPSNVKSLLSTGILDGVHVKYVSWSREKSLKGTIKGTGYLCGCSDCNYNKTLNAYEFERHANCKTKHPNNHIYFMNGKTIYAIVQELKNTPQEILFDAIQTMTGSLINQKNFCIWKASYQVASRELQRIYGKDENAMPS